VDLYSPRGRHHLGADDGPDRTPRTGSGSRRPAPETPPRTALEVNVDEFRRGRDADRRPRPRVIRYSTLAGHARTQRKWWLLRQLRPGASTTFTFTGTSVTWLPPGPSHGSSRTCSSTAGAWRRSTNMPPGRPGGRPHLRGLTNAKHVIRVVCGAPTTRQRGRPGHSDAFVLG
jgi:hypothetical protein